MDQNLYKTIFYFENVQYMFYSLFFFWLYKIEISNLQACFGERKKKRIMRKINHF